MSAEDNKYLIQYTITVQVPIEAEDEEEAYDEAYDIDPLEEFCRARFP